MKRSKPRKSSAKAVAPSVLSCQQPLSDLCWASDLITSALNQPATPESVCDRARRVAREAQEAADKKRDERRNAFLNTICAPHERKLNDDGTYTICGWRWYVRGGHKEDDGVYLSFNESVPLFWSGYRPSINRHQGFDLNLHHVHSLKQFGDALLAIDRQVEISTHSIPIPFWAALSSSSIASSDGFHESH